jgi:hypothetical protein
LNSPRRSEIRTFGREKRSVLANKPHLIAVGVSVWHRRLGQWEQARTGEK